MAKGFDRLHLKSASQARNEFDLSCDHLTTMDFGQIVPLWNEESIPGDSFNVGGNYFSRLAPLVKPTYGKFSFKTVAFFVPYYMVADDAESWFAGKTVFEGVTPVFRYFTINYLVTLFTSSTHGLLSTGTAQNAEFVYTDASGVVKYNVFTAKGRYFIKILNSLGYGLPENADLQTSGSWLNTVGAYKLSAFPLLAFAKAYNDWMSQATRYNNSQLSLLLHNIRHNVAVSGKYSSSGNITASGLFTILDSVLLNYESDYFTSAWQSPNSSLGVQGSAEQLTAFDVPSTGNGTIPDNVRQDSLNSMAVIPTDVQTGLTVLNQRTLDFLKRFDDYVRRNNYAGSRVVNQIYSRFGIKTSDYRSNYAEFVGSDTIPVQVGDVTATSSSTSEVLGDYAGKGIMSGNHSYTFNCSDYGLCMIFGYYTVNPMYSYGFDKKVLRNHPLDWYTPEFDGMGAEGIPYIEVFENPSSDPSQDLSNSLNVFGFTERYNSYRYGRDRITGDFRKYSNSDGMNTWHSGRLLNNLREGNLMYAQSSSFNTLRQTNSEYNRIFSVTGSQVDHFYLICRFTVHAVRNMLNLNQVPRLGEGSVDMSKNGNEVS